MPGVIDARTPYGVVAAFPEFDSAARERDSEVPFDEQQHGRSCFVGDPALAFVAGGLYSPLDLDRVGVADVAFVREEMAEKPTPRESSVDGSVAESPVGAYVITASMLTNPVLTPAATYLLLRSVDSVSPPLLAKFIVRPEHQESPNPGTRSKRAQSGLALTLMRSALVTAATTRPRTDCRGDIVGGAGRWVSVISAAPHWRRIGRAATQRTAPTRR